MRREWELDDLVASWTLVDADLELLASKHGATRLSFGLMVKFFEIEGRQLGLDAGRVGRLEHNLSVATGEARRRGSSRNGTLAPPTLHGRTRRPTAYAACVQNSPHRRE